MKTGPPLDVAVTLKRLFYSWFILNFSFFATTVLLLSFGFLCIVLHTQMIGAIKNLLIVILTSDNECCSPLKCKQTSTSDWRVGELICSMWSSGDSTLCKSGWRFCYLSGLDASMLFISFSLKIFFSEENSVPGIQWLIIFIGLFWIIEIER